MANFCMAQLRLDSLGIIVLLAAALAAPIPRTGHAAEVCAPALARIVSLQGIVEFRASESEPWTDAALNDLLCADSWIRVGPSSRAALALPNDSVLRLDQQTTVRLRAPAEEARSLLDLLLGTLYLFSHRPRALEVDTPFVNAATEGTEFLISVGADQTRIIVFEGRILAQNPHGELLLASGDAAVAAAGEAPRAQIVAQPRDAVAWTFYYPPILTALAERKPGARDLPPGLRTAIDRVAANDYPGALRALDAVPEAARDARYWTYRGAVLLNVGRADEARDAIDRALALDPEAGEALAQRSIIEIVQNRPEQALTDARRAAELSPESGAAAVALSYALQANFQLEEARDILRQATERVPEDALVFARLSEIEQSLGELGAARDAAEQAVALAPDLARTQMVLGFAALTRIQIDEAKAAFERAIALDSAEPFARLGLGLAIIRSGDLDAGGREIEIAAGLDPNNSLIRSYLGKTYFEERRDPLDVEQYAIAKELDPNDPTPWFYDAIRLQTVNRPIEALRNIERSIELNDNRAVYRSRLLLDQDLATRETSLARIYDDLGFEQLGLLEATNSLSLDPTNFSAHRFLSDTYLGEPRVEIARVSELLQAQLLQPLNLNPIQPSLAFTDLNVVANAGPGGAAFNEFTPLFVRNGAQLTASGVVGNQATLGVESVASGLWNNVSLSAGQYHFETDGFRDNNDLNHNIYDVFAQIAVTPQLDFQLEYRRRETDQGDRALNFDPDSFSPTERVDIDQGTFRVGSHLKLSPGSEFILSGLYTDRREHLSSSDVLPPSGPAPETLFEETDKFEDKAYQGEIQYLFNTQLASLVAGGGAYDVDQRARTEEDETPCFLGDCPRSSSTKNEIDAANAYVYGHLRWPASVTWTLGTGYETFDQTVGEESIDVEGPTPKFGIRWRLTDRLLLRAAAFKTVKRAVTINQTIEPTQVAGFNQFFDDVNGTKSTRYGVGVDARLSEDVFVGLEASHRNISPPRVLVSGDDVQIRTLNQDENEISGYIYWTIGSSLALNGKVIYNAFDQSQQDAGPNPNRIETFLIPIGIRYFHLSGLFAGFGLTYLNQSVDRPSTAQGARGDNNAVLADITLGYRLPKRFGIISIGVNNLFDQNFEFQDESFRSSELLNPRFLPNRLVLARLNLYW